MNLLVFPIHRLPSRLRVRPCAIAAVSLCVSHYPVGQQLCTFHSFCGSVTLSLPSIMLFPCHNVTINKAQNSRHASKPRRKIVAIGKRQQSPRNSRKNPRSDESCAQKPPRQADQCLSSGHNNWQLREPAYITKHCWSTWAVREYSSQASQTSTMPILRSLSCSTALPSNRQCSNSTCQGLLRQLFTRSLSKKTGIFLWQPPDGLGFVRIMTITSSSRPL